MQLPFVSRELLDDANIEIRQLKARLQLAEDSRDQAIEMAQRLASVLEKMPEPAAASSEKTSFNPSIRNIKAAAAEDARTKYEQTKAPALK